MARKEMVSDEYVEKLQQQEVKKDDFSDTVDGVDRGFGRIFSKIGQYFRDNW